MTFFKKLIFPLSVLVMFSACVDPDDGGGDGTPDPATILSSVFVTSNTSGDVSALDFTTAGSFIRTFITPSTDSEGVFYDKATNQLTQVSRSQNVLNIFGDISTTPNGSTVAPVGSSNTDLTSPRDLAVLNNIYVVSDNADVDGDETTPDGRFYIYTKNASDFTLRNTITVNFKVWGIEFIGNDLYAVVDQTNEVAKFTSFTSNTTDVVLEPTKKVSIDGITRTHGISYDGTTLVVTDIGEASGALAATDGGFHIIPGFLALFDSLENDGIVTSNNSFRVDGNFSLLGNPVAVEYDAVSNTVIVAERLNDNGRLLFFENVEVGGNLVPTGSIAIPGVSSVQFVDYD